MSEKLVYELELKIDEKVVEYFRTATDIEEMKAVLAHLVSESAKSVVEQVGKRSYEDGFSDGWDSCLEELETPSIDASKYMH